MRPPRKVKVGYKDYAVRLLPTAEMAGNLGACHTDRGLIDLDEEQSRQQLAETALHEVCHAIWHVWQLPARAAEEKAVSALSVGLAGVFRDNPEAIKWILAGLKAK
jgi:predicted Zn-dependent protease